MVEKSFSREQARAHILHKLARHRNWGAKHTPLLYARSGLPKEFLDKSEDLAKELANEGFLTWLKKTNKIHISLNSARKKEIIELIERYFGKQIW
ncbi:hypothetical protein FJZ26_00415 [Candidatus Parvarchaeota archaeon]|nr:hypothetical protein [Candidatus Parvarchaeota archaeon]